MTQSVTVEYDKDQEVNIWAGAKKYIREAYLRMFQGSFLSMAQDKELTGTDFRVYFALLSHIDFENKILVSQKILADELETGQNHVSAAIKVLCQKRIIVHIGNIGSQKVYYLHGDFGWKGRASKLASGYKAIDDSKVPGQRSFIHTEIFQEDTPIDLLIENLSRKHKLPIEAIKALLDDLIDSEKEEKAEN